MLLVLVGSITAIAGGMAYPFLGILFGKLIDDMNSSACREGDPDQIKNAVRTKVLLIVCIAAVHFVLIYIYMGCWSLFGERLVRRLRTRYLSALLRQEASYFDSLPSGEVSSRLDADLQKIQGGTSEKVGIFITSVSYFVGAYTVAFMLDARLAIRMFSLVPAYIIMGWGGNYLSSKYSAIVTERVAAATSIASECLSNIKVVQAFGAEYRLEKIFSSHLIKMQQAATSNTVTAAVQLGLLYFISTCANSLAIWQGSHEIADSMTGSRNGMTVGHVYTVILVLVDASFIITRVAPFLQIFSEAADAASYLFSTIDRQSLIDGTSLHQGAVPDHIDGEIEFQNVAFRYPSRPDKQILDSLSLKIQPRKLTAIVGRSGSGKSTLASLIPRLYDVQGGQIVLDGYDLRRLNVRWLRRQVAVVEQNPTLFDASILENIAFGLMSVDNPNFMRMQEAILDGRLSHAVEVAQREMNIDDAVASDQNLKEILRLVRQAATRSGARGFIEDLEYGFATKSGHKGRQLSGGQTQRIAIARALIRESPILILDEATAALDYVSERLIQSCLETYCKDKTIICIAHRLSTIKKADNIIVMQDGRFVEQGAYLELIAQQGTFASMVALQDLETEQKLEPLRMSLREKSSSYFSSESHEIVPRGRRTSFSTDLIHPEFDIDEDAPLLGGAVVEEDEGKGYGPASFTQTFGRVLEIAKPDRIYIVFGIIGAAFLGAGSPGNAIVFGNMIGKISPCQDPSVIVSTGAFFARLFFLLAIIEILSATARGSFFGIVAERVLLRTRILTFRSLLHQDVTWHESDARTPNTLLSYLTTDAQALSGMTGTILGVSFSIVVSMGAGIIMSHIIAWKIAIVLLSTVPLLLLSGYLRLRMLALFHEKHRAAFARSVAVAKDAVDASRTVAIFSLEQHSVQTYERSLAEPYAATLKSILIGNFYLASSYSVSNLIYALAYWWGAIQVATGRYTQTQFFIVLPALLISAQSCGQFFSLAPDMSHAGVAARKIFAQMDIGPADRSVQMRESDDEDFEYDPESAAAGVNPIEPALSTTDGGMAVKFSKARFSYPSRPNIQVLRGLSLSMIPNKFYALTGPSGSGKSTIFSLIERFYRLSSGSVLLDEHNIAYFSEARFRNDIALVPQENILFDESIRFNIALGARHGDLRAVTDDEIEQVCRLANIHDLITSLPEGYATRCGTSGSLLSGGQKQRLAIARALIRKPRLLLLDESTSALDAESERLWQTTLDNIMKRRDMTVIAIAHRLSTIRKADCIFLIERGVCVEKGSHDELFERSESYRENVLHQALS